MHGNENLRYGHEIFIEAVVLAHLKCQKYHSISTTGAPVEDERCCNVCLEKYAEGDNLGKLDFCRHEFHFECKKKWLVQKNLCPICKETALEIDFHDPLKKKISVQ